MKRQRRRAKRIEKSPAVVEQFEVRQLLSAVSVDPAAIVGNGNNVDNPEWGSTDIELLRLASVEYADATSSPSGEDRPGARDVSNAIAAQSESTPNARNLTDFVWIWGQFIDHDIDLTEGADPEEGFNIEVPAGDVFFDPFGTGTVEISLTRSNYVEGSDSSDGVRQQINSITAFLDGSVIYGSDQERADALRTFSSGMLTTSDGNLLPFNDTGLDNAGSTDSSLFLAGDVRANENVLLTSMHTVFVREHNRIAAELAEQNSSLTDEQLYQQARAIVTAELQAITYNEFLPALLGPYALADYSGYDPTVNPGIANEFSTAAYRFGHSMLSSELLRLDEDGRVIENGNLALQAAFFNPSEILENGIDAGLRGAATQLAQEVDTRIIDDVRNFLFGPPGAGGLDLASLNIQRGRDHGLADFNQTRIDLGLSPVQSFDQITSDPELAAALESMYGSVDNVDLWVGGLAEDHLSGSSMGETFTTIITDQFERIRAGDRFWYQNTFSGRMLEQLENTHLSDIIERNTGIQGLQTNVFFLKGTETLYVDAAGSNNIRVQRRDNTVEVVDGASRKTIASRPLNEVAEVVIRGTDGRRERFTVDASLAEIQTAMNITIDGGEGPRDTLLVMGTRNDDVMTVVDNTVSVQQLDIVFQDVEMLLLQGQDGNDILDATASSADTVVLDGGAGDDVLLGSDASDRMFGGSGMDVLKGRAGNDDLSGGDGDDRLYGQQGHDRLNGGQGNDLVMQEGDGNRQEDMPRLNAFLQTTLRIRNTDNNFENWGGLGEKWIWSQRGWLFITPDGNLFQWDGSAGANGQLIATTGPETFNNLSLLTTSPIQPIDDDSPIAMNQMVTSMRDGLALRLSSNLFENWAGLGERWIWGQGQWYFITPDGMLYEYDPTASSDAPGILVAELTPEYFNDPTRLAASPLQRR